AVYATHVARDASRFFRAGSSGSEYTVYDASGAELSKGPGVDGRDRFEELSDDGRRVLMGACLDAASELSTFDDRGERLGTLRVDARVMSATFDARGRVIGWIEDGGPLFRWDPAAGRVERWFEPPPVMVRGNLRRSARCPGRIALTNGSAQFIVDEETGAV